MKPTADQIKPVAETLAVFGAPVFIRTVGDGSSPDAVVARWRHPGTQFELSPSDAVCIAVSMKQVKHVWQQPGKTMKADIEIGGFSVLPAHEGIKVAVQGDADVLRFFLRESFLDAAVEGQFACRGLFNSHDSELLAAAMQLFVASTRGEPDDALLFASGVRRMSGRLLNYDNHRESERAHGGLANASRRRVNDLIISSLEDATAPSPTLDQLASAACLSVNHFIRAFHRETGVTPHRHVVFCRLRRAMLLLKKPGISVAGVADEVGFATPAHFVATFKRRIGVTPGAFQAASRSRGQSFAGHEDRSHRPGPCQLA